MGVTKKTILSVERRESPTADILRIGSPASPSSKEAPFFFGGRVNWQLASLATLYIAPHLEVDATPVKPLIAVVTLNHESTVIRASAKAVTVAPVVQGCYNLRLQRQENRNVFRLVE